VAGGQASLLDRKSSFGSGGIKGRAMAPGAAGVMKQGSSYGSGLMADNNNPAGADIDESYEEQPDTEVSQQQQNDANNRSVDSYTNQQLRDDDDQIQQIPRSTKKGSIGKSQQNKSKDDSRSIKSDKMLKNISAGSFDKSTKG